MFRARRASDSEALQSGAFGKSTFCAPPCKMLGQWPEEGCDKALSVQTRPEEALGLSPSPKTLGLRMGRGSAVTRTGMLVKS